MKRFALLILFLLTPLYIIAQGKGALISFETDTIDYGEILKGSDGVRTFIFENIGDAPIEIQGVKSSCGCTIPKKPKAPIPPGEKGEIQVKYEYLGKSYIQMMRYKASMLHDRQIDANQS